MTSSPYVCVYVCNKFLARPYTLARYPMLASMHRTTARRPLLHGAARILAEGIGPCSSGTFVIIIIIILLKNEKIKVTLCENAAGALYIVSKMCVDGQRKVLGETS